jgi:hypothetical protein
MRIGDVDLRKAVIEGPEVVDGSASMHHNDQRSFPAEKVDQELKERVDCEGLAKLTFKVVDGENVSPRRYHELDRPTLQHPKT